jgi:aconitase A
VAQWSADDEPSREIAYRPARVLMQDFTGVPAIVVASSAEPTDSHTVTTTASRPLSTRPALAVAPRAASEPL